MTKELLQTEKQRLKNNHTTCGISIGPTATRTLLGHLTKLEWGRRILCINVNFLIFLIVLWLCMKISLFIRHTCLALDSLA